MFRFDCPISYCTGRVCPKSLCSRTFSADADRRTWERARADGGLAARPVPVRDARRSTAGSRAGASGGAAAGDRASSVASSRG